ncbi:MAG: dockerin type I domain-containing protein, partial [Defluviitaleaceae bacterium]|nr:dockerin type I domain-containing protein [Defluviitaleaceae bacterium]
GTVLAYTVNVTRQTPPYDINGDGKIDAADLALIMANMNKKASSSAIAKKCDVDGNGIVDMNDYNLVASYIAAMAAK